MKRPLGPRMVGVLAALALLATGIAPAAAQSVLYSISSNAFDNALRRIDPATGATLASVPITVAGKTIITGNGLAAHPQTGQLFGLLTFDDTPFPPERFLVTIDPQSGVATEIGNTARSFAGLAFAADGTLFGVTGDGGQNPETLYTINPANAQSTLFQPLGNGTGGEAIAFNPVNGQLYHASGFEGVRNADRIFESVNLQSHAVTPIPLSGFDANEITALTYSQAFFLGADINFGDQGPEMRFLMITPGGVVTLLGTLDHTSKGLAFVSGPPATVLVASVLPSSRSVDVTTAATAFATIFNAGPNTAFQAGIGLASQIPAFLIYNATSCATNAVIGGDNAPVNIPANTAACFVITITPFSAFAPTEVAFTFAAINAPAVPVLTGINTLLMSASDTPVADMVALAATPNGNGIVDIPGTNGIGVFAVATVNVGAPGLVTASANTGGTVLPVLIQICETDPGSGQCKAPPGASVTTQVNSGQTPTFGIFIFGGGTVPFDPAVNRVFVVFVVDGVVRGRTSVALRTVFP